VGLLSIRYLDRLKITTWQIIGTDGCRKKLCTYKNMYLKVTATNNAHMWISPFIPALAGDSQDLGISKDQLAGFTQKASAYRLVNVFFFSK